MLIRAFTAIALLWAAPVTAQAVAVTTAAAADPNVYVSPTRLTGKVEGQFTASGKVDGTGKKGTVWIERGQQPDGSWLYWRKGYAPAVEPAAPEVAPPPVVPPAEAAADSALIGGQLFLRNGQIVAGFNAGGGLGTLNRQAPAGWPRIANRASVGLLRARDLTEAVAVLRVEETFSVGAPGVYDFNGELVGRVTAAGGWSTAGIWTGIGRAGIAIEQRATLDSGLVRFAMTLTNATGQTMRDVRYKRTVDFDTLASPTVTPRIAARGSVETTLSNGAVTVLRSDDPRAVASFGGEVIESPHAPLYDKPQAVGWKGGKADAGSNLVFRLGDLAPGASVSFAFELGFAG